MINVSTIYSFNNYIKVACTLTIAEKVFKEVSESDIRYAEGRKSLDACWLWVERGDINADSLYELIDNEDFTGISEYAEEEEDLNIARLWSLLVDAVSYTAWQAYKKEGAKYLPQSLEGIKDESIEVYINSATETTFINDEEIEEILERILAEYEELKDIIITKEYFLNKIKV
ncbi:immunity 6 family protein [Metabacillus sp. GX 13764]|uniref:Imm6 family immunity protein n=1 Tax=Metabacillus kandeliae TaxID=2900151 RepID=UPI001E2E6CBD|nr:Imm6 family immunity protein [Metabacillus kandeliae]MCD7036739.1 immunity 6 family protein [Metabacillus kandeliae]